MSPLRTILVLVSAFVFNETVHAENCTVYNCADKSEKKILASYGDIFERKGDALSIRLLDGRRVSLGEKSDSKASESPAVFTLISYWSKKNMIAVDRVKYDGEDHEVFIYDISSAQRFFNTGVQVRGWPVLSPDGKRIAAFGFDLESEFAYNGLSIFNVEGERISKEIEIRSEFWGVSAVSWRNDHELSVEYSKLSNDSYKKSTGSIVQEKGLWGVKSAGVF